MSNKNPIHVLHVLNSAHGGSALSTFELIESLRKIGVASSLVCYNNASAQQQERISQLVQGRVIFIPLCWMNKRIRSAFWKRPLIEAKSIFDTWRGYRFQDRIEKLISQHGINIIHTSTILNPEGAIAARRNNLPHVWHVRELVGPTKHYHFYNYKRWSEFVKSHCDYLVANSTVTESCLLQYFPSEKIRYIPNGIYVNEFKPKNQDIRKEKLVVGMIGSVTTRWKNHEFFIRVAAALSDQKGVAFRIYGALPLENDPYYSDLRALVRTLGVEAGLQFIPFKKPTEIIEEIDIMFHPTEFESFGRIFAEAMAGGVPVVAVAEGGALELIQNEVNGLLIANNSVEEAKRALLKLIHSAPLRNEYGKNGRAIVETNYSIETLTHKMHLLYSELVDKE